jgi:hypothetical protein
MGKKFSVRNGIYYTLYYSQWVAGIVAAGLTVLASKDPTKYQGWPSIQYTVAFGKENAALAVGLAVYVGVANFACKKIGPPWAWKAIKHIIDRFQKQVIKGSVRPKIDEHRITLFKFVRWNFHLKDWLSLKDRCGLNRRLNIKDLRTLRWFKPVTRSGHVTQNLTTRFPLFEIKTRGEGVIGEVWKTEGVKRIDNLPQIPPSDEEDQDPDEAYNIYAKEVNCNEEWLRKETNRTKARSYCGIPIEVLNGKLWGVIIIDSMEPQLKVTDEQIELAALALGKFIEKA